MDGLRRTCERCALLLFLARAAWGEPTIRFERLTPEDGLAQGTVAAILQDRSGFLWFATQDGLNRYDGHRFEVFTNDPQDPSTLSHDWILELLEDPSGDLWIGTDGGGLNLLDRETGTFSVYRHDPADPTSLTGDRVGALRIDRGGGLWVGTQESGLNRYEVASGTFERFRHDPADPTSLSDDRVRAVYEDRAGNLWIGTLGGLNLFQPEAGTFRRYRALGPPGESLADDRVRSILEDATGVLWIGTLGGLHRFDRASGRFVLYRHDPQDPESLSENRVRALFEDRQKRLWVGTDGGLHLYCRDTESFVRYRNRHGDPSSLMSNSVVSIYQDRGGILWVAALGAVHKWNPRSWAFAHYRSDPEGPSALSSDSVFALSTDREGRLFVGTFGGGLNVYDRGRGEIGRPLSRPESYRHRPGDAKSLSDDRVTSLLHDRRGTLWAGTAGGLNRFEKETGTFVRYLSDADDPTSLSHPGVMSIFEDSAGTLWVGTAGGGLNRYEGDRQGFTRFRHDPADKTTLASDRVTSFAEDAEGFLWIGTVGGGLDRFDRARATFRHFRSDPDRAGSLPHDTVNTLHQSADGTLWIGTSGGGLARLRRPGDGRAVFATYMERDGLANDVVYGILEDGSGKLWLSTNKGLSRFDPESETFKSYHYSHGLQANEFNLGAYHRDAGGELYFGGVNGFNRFDPAAIQGHDDPPPLALTAFLIAGRKAPLEAGSSRREFALRHDERVFSFEFAVLDFAAPQSNRLAYRIEGLSEDWIDNGTVRRVALTNLDPGRYLLEVKGSNGDGVWNEEGLALTLTIAPPFWQTSWALTFYAVLLSLAAFGLHAVRRRRRRRQRALEEAREAARAAEAASRAKDAFLAHMSHEIRTPMNGVIGMTSLLQSTELTAEQGSYLDTIRSSGEALLRILNDILDFSKIESRKLDLEVAPFDLRSVIEEAFDLLAPTAAGKGLDLTYHIEAGTPESLRGDAQRTRQILVNLLSNGVKFTREGGVDVKVSAERIDRDRHEIHVAVRDSGIGIPKDRLRALFRPFTQADSSTTRRFGGTGLGLAISKELSELMGGRAWAESVEGEGSTFHFTFVCEKLGGEDRSYLHHLDPLLRGKLLLIVNRGEGLNLMIHRHAQAWGMRPETARSTAEAMARLKSGGEAPEMVIASRELLDEDADLWAREVRRRARFRPLSVVLLVRLGHERNAPPSYLPAKSAQIQKPIKPAAVYEALIGCVAEPQKRPSRSRKTGASVRVEPEAAPPRSLRILLAEDNVVNQMVALRTLRGLGHQADAVANGLEVLEALDRQTYDVILMDVQMPEMDGFEAARRIREMCNEARPYMIALTAHAMRGDRARCLAAGMDDYLTKPLQTDVLQAALRRAPSEDPVPRTQQGL